jgi:hypothetical protein
MTLALLSLVLLVQEARTHPVKQAAYVRVAKAHSIARDAQLLGFVAAKNARQESREEIRRKDAEWAGAPDHALRRALTQDDCANRLRTLLADDAVIVEALVMDNKGALVCASVAPSDYWQGDEPKWQKTFQEGRDPYVDELSLDSSTNEYAVQLSVPMLQAAERVGALTLTIRVPREIAAPR